MLDNQSQISNDSPYRKAENTTNQQQEPEAEPIQKTPELAKSISGLARDYKSRLTYLSSRRRSYGPQFWWDSSCSR